MAQKIGMGIVIFGGIVIAILVYILFAYSPKTSTADNTPRTFKGPTSAPFVKGPTSPPPKIGN